MIALIVARKRRCDLDGYMEKKHVQMARIRYISLVSVKRDYTNRDICIFFLDRHDYSHLSCQTKLAQDLIGACWKQNTANTSGECWMGWVVAGMQDDPSLNVLKLRAHKVL